MRGLLNSFKAFLLKMDQTLAKFALALTELIFKKWSLFSFSFIQTLFRTSQITHDGTIRFIDWKLPPFTTENLSHGIDKTGQLTQNRRFSSNSGRFKLRHVFETDLLDKVATPKLTPTSCLPRKVLGIFFHHQLWKHQQHVWWCREVRSTNWCNGPVAR